MQMTCTYSDDAWSPCSDPDTQDNSSINNDDFEINDQYIDDDLDQYLLDPESLNLIDPFDMPQVQPNKEDPEPSPGCWRKDSALSKDSSLCLTLLPPGDGVEKALNNSISSFHSSTPTIPWSQGGTWHQFSFRLRAAPKLYGSSELGVLVPPVLET